MADGYLTTYGANAILGGTPHPQIFYAAGHLGNPGADGIANAAAETRRLSVSLDVAAGGAVTNVGTSTISNAAATEDWTHLTLWDAVSGGNPWWVLELPAPLSITAGAVLGFDTAVLTLSFELWS